MPDDDQMLIDFGTEELNDPNYETNVTEAQTDDTVTQTDGAGSAEQVAAGEEQAAPDAQQSQSEPGSDPNAAAPAADGQQQSSDASRPRTDKDGNVVDAQGNIVAKAGAERRQYERTQAQANHIDRLTAENKQLRETDSMARALNEVPQKLGLDMRETEMGLQAIASFKKDPVATARWMLQETMRLGYNLNQIVGEDANGQISGGTLDLAAVKSMIAEQVAPLVGDRNAAQAQSDAQQAAQRDYDEFVANHDHAAVHDDVLGNMLRDNPSLTPQVAYWQLREYAAKNGLNFSQPLRAQVEARQSGQQQQQQPQPQPNGNANPQAQQRPMPHGGAPTAVMQQGGNMNHPDDNWDTIVQQSLAEAGFAH